MNIIYTGRHDPITDEMKQYIEKRMKKIKFYFENIMNVDVVMETVKKTYHFEIKIKSKHDFFVAKDSGYDWDKVVDSVTDKIEREVKKKKDKIKDKHRRMKQKESEVE